MNGHYEVGETTLKAGDCVEISNAIFYSGIFISCAITTGHVWMNWDIALICMSRNVKLKGNIS